MADTQETVDCGGCERKWPKDSEQAISVEKYGECIVCRLHSMTTEEMDEISAEAQSRVERRCIDLYRRGELLGAVKLLRMHMPMSSSLKDVRARLEDLAAKGE